LRTGRQEIFITIHTEGGLLPADLLQRIADGDRDLDGLDGTSYHLASGERLNEAVSRAWNRLLGAWSGFRTAIDRLPESDAGTTVTRERWLLILFQELGYGRLMAARAPEIEGKSYPISHFWQNVPIHLVGFRIDLDRRSAGVAGAARTSPHSLVQEFLNRSDKSLWGFVSNGNRLRILRDNATLTRQAYVEFDLQSMMDGETYSDFVMLWLLCHQSRVEADRPEQCWLEKWSQAAQEQGTRALEKLRGGVEEAINALGRGFLSHFANGALREKLRTGQLTKQDYYRELLRMVYRLLFLFVAEDRDLLLVPGASPEVRERHERFYSTARIRHLAEKRKGTQHVDLWRGLRLVMDKLGSDEGCPELGLLALGSFLWSHDAIKEIEGCDISNRDLLDAIRALTFIVEGNIRRNVDYRNLGADELGSVYESLLELHPDVNLDAGTFALTVATGHERKTTGSYYTPTSLITCLLDSALDPVMDERINDAKRMANGEWRTEEEILDVCEILQGLGRLDKGYGYLRGRVQTVGNLPEGGTVRDDLANAESGSGDTGQHRRGMGTLRDTGVSSVSSNRPGQHERTGDTPPSVDSSGTDITGSGQSGSGQSDNSGQTTDSATTKPEVPAELLNLWRTIPLATRHSLLAERKLLSLRVCDPACGSGHFLVAAAHRIAKRLAQVRTGDEEPSPEAIRTALRDVIGHCIYGVDLNPMAVELCKVSLWIEALEPGKPLSFLDHHIQCGNSLLGATPALMAKGIPDEAFNPIEGDDKKYCAEYKKQNRKERAHTELTLFDKTGMPWEQMGNLAAGMMNLDALEDNTIRGVREKHERYEKFVKSSSYMYGRLLADAWCAAFVWKKCEDKSLPYPITEEVFRQIRHNPYSCPEWMKQEIERLANQYRFFHWHLAFPDVFRLLGKDERPENEQTGWSGGFDVALGNPPWERVKIQEKEWFSVRRPDIASAQNAAARRKMIAALRDEDPDLWCAFYEALRLAEGASLLTRNSNRYPFCGRGDINTYALFAETNWSIINSVGRVGCILPSGIATDDTTKHFFRNIVKKQSLVALLGFINEEKLFPAVLHNFKFCLLILCGSHDKIAHPDFVFNCYNMEHLADRERHFSLTAEEIDFLNPNTGTCPVFFCGHSAQLAKAIYHRVPILYRQGADNSWEIEFYTMFHMSNDSGCFKTVPGDGLVRLYEAKMMNQYNHRYASYERLGEGERSHMLPEVPAPFLMDPHYTVTPCYYVPLTEVQARTRERYPSKWLVGYREITSAGLLRTTIYSALPSTGVSNKIVLVSFEEKSKELVPCFLSCMNSFILDFLARQKLGGASFSFYVMRQLPMIPTSAFNQTCEWDLNGTVSSWLDPRVLELTFCSWDLEPFAKDSGYVGPPFRWGEERRFLLRCELDAAFFHLYLGTPQEWREKSSEDLLRYFPMPRDAVEYIMETFPIVKRRDEQRYGEYRTKRVILEIYDAMQRAIETGDPYQTLLDPPPADPRVAHPPKEEKKGD